MQKPDVFFFYCSGGSNSLKLGLSLQRSKLLERAGPRVSRPNLLCLVGLIEPGLDQTKTLKRRFVCDGSASPIRVGSRSQVCMTGFRCSNLTSSPTWTHATYLRLRLASGPPSLTTSPMREEIILTWFVVMHFGSLGLFCVKRNQTDRRGQNSYFCMRQ